MEIIMSWLEDMKLKHPERFGVKVKKKRFRRERFREKWKRIVIEAMGGCCQCCGYSACQGALELHHINPTIKEHSMSQILSEPGYFFEGVEELKKCVLVCANCHREIHAGLRKVPENAKKVDVEYLKEKLIEIARITSERLGIKPKWKC